MEYCFSCGRYIRAWAVDLAICIGEDLSLRGVGRARGPVDPEKTIGYNIQSGDYFEV